jgi:hypothetical protein
MPPLFACFPMSDVMIDRAVTMTTGHRAAEAERAITSAYRL